MTAAIEVLDSKDAGDQVYLTIRLGGVTIKGARILRCAGQAPTLALPQSVELSPGLYAKAREVALINAKPLRLQQAPVAPTPLEPPAAQVAWSEEKAQSYIDQIAARFTPDNDPIEL